MPYCSIPALHLAQDRRRQFRAGAAQRMAQSDGAAVGIDAFRIEPRFADHRQRLRGEGFVQLDHADVVQLQSGQRKAFGIATTGPMPMISGGTPPTAKLTKRAIGFRPSSLAFFSDMTMRRRRAVAGLRGIARRHRAVGLKHRLQFGQRFERGVGARTFVLLEDRHS